MTLEALVYIYIYINVCCHFSVVGIAFFFTLVIIVEVCQFKPWNGPFCFPLQLGCFILCLLSPSLQPNINKHILFVFSSLSSPCPFPTSIAASHLLAPPFWPLSLTNSSLPISSLVSHPVPVSPVQDWKEYGLFQMHDLFFILIFPLAHSPLSLLLPMCTCCAHYITYIM